MKNIDFFKKQAKYLVEDWKTRTINPGLNDEFEGEPYLYDSRHFDMYYLSKIYELGDNFSLQKAQHIIAQMAGFKKWDELSNSNEDELSIARIRFMHLSEWDKPNWELYCKTVKWDKVPLESKFPIIKQQLYNKMSFFLDVSQYYQEEILYGMEREVALFNGLSFLLFDSTNLECTIECTPCSRTFKAKELTVVQEYGIGQEHDYIACKHYPECEGTLGDLVSVPE